MTWNSDPDLLIAESDVSEVFDAPYSPNYNVRSKLDDSEHIVNSYIREMEVEDGWVNFEVTSKRKKERSIGRPFHFYTSDEGGTLFAMKRFKHNKTDSFALNHEMFALDWGVAVILHFFDGNTPMLFIASRGEWLGSPNMRIGTLGEELQVSIEAPGYRLLPTSVMPEIKWWVSECEKANAKMRK